ncbi:hypothetical protein NEOLEDRAFT_1152627 [Neolentinus lepideus HHB14362 ss-1]|uniref:DNA 3'-5' helicase n=1 Tax=Neolentinus lepideus HHB14362 ss-1 TaxID=1314782 RepID=A0A165MJW6_9AGAM|nr:hypothetical protein NEOLEDRAFT_1152627 [Neolentinus lepideus HHB14362 ss-1]
MATANRNTAPSRCKFCRELFSTRGARDHHQKSCGHRKDNHPAASEILESSSVGFKKVVDDNQIITHPFLDSLDLVVNSSIHAVCCKTCMVAIVRDHIPGHIHANHAALAKYLDEDMLLDVLDELEVEQSLPRITDGLVVQEIQGLKVHDGFLCNQCSKIRLNRKSMLQHYSDIHPDLPPPLQFTACKAQRLTTGAGSSSIYCKVEKPISSPDTPWEQMITTAQMEMAGTEVAEDRDINARMVSPWLLTTRWHEHVQGYNISELCHLISTPRKDEYPDLPHLVLAYMERATNLINHTDELVLQVLNTPDPAKTGINNTPFHKMQQNSTLRQYISPVIRLLAFLLRPKDKYQVPIPIALGQALQTLATWLSNPAEDKDGLVALDAVLGHIWMIKWLPSERNHIPCPTVRLLALSTLRPDGGHADARDVTPIIARLEYCMRLFFLTRIKTVAEELYHGDDDLGCKALSCWFTEKVQSPFNTLRSLQHRAAAIALKTTSQPRVYWTDRIDYTSMLYRGTKITQEDLQSIFSRTEDAAIQTWQQDVLCGLPIPSLDWKDVVDDLVNTDVGYSFLSDQRNPVFADTEILLHAVMDNAKTRDCFLFKINYGQGWEWNRDTMRGWLAKYATFEGILMARCEMLSGAPARGTEITSMTFKNTKTRAARNLLAFGPYISIVTLYHKTAFLVHILYPDRVDIKKLYAEHLFVNNCKAFESHILTSIMGDFSLPVLGIQLGINPWRHVSTSWKRKHCKEMFDLLQEEIQESADVLQAGHNADTENRIYGLSQFALASMPEDLIPLFLDASTRWHNTCKVVPGGVVLPYHKARSCDFSKYAPPAISKITPVPEVLQELVQVLTPLLNQNMAPHTHLAESELSCQSSSTLCLPTCNTGPTSTAVSISSVPSSQSQEVLESNVSPRISGPLPTTTAPFHFGMFSMKPSSTASAGSPHITSILEHLQAPPQNISSLQRLVKPASSIPATSLNPVWFTSTSAHPTPFNRMAVTHAGASAKGKTILPELSNASMSPTLQQALQCLRTLLGKPEATWTSSGQKDALSAVLNLKNDVLTVMATGSGKSMLMIIPTLLEDAVTVGVIPLQSLMDDYELRLRDMRVPYEVFSAESTHLSGQKNLVLVSADRAQMASWTQALAELHERRKVVRMVYDEAHEAIISSDYRPALRNSYELRQFSMQLVALSATVSPASQPSLINAFGLMPNNTIVIRTSTVRPEIQYVLENPRRMPEIHDYVKEVLEIYGPDLQEPDRVLIFVPFKTQGEALAKKLGYEFYQATLTNQERQQMHKRWLSGASKVMVCTQAFGAGNDYKHVRMVIHAGSPREMISFLQESGRGGRDGMPAISLVLPHTTYNTPAPSVTGTDHKGQLAMYNWLQSLSRNTCLRQGLTHFCDGEGDTCKGYQSAQWCIICQRKTKDVCPPAATVTKRTLDSSDSPFDEAASEAKRRKIERIMQFGGRIQAVHEALEFLNACCVLCRLVKEEEHPKHDIEDCPAILSQGFPFTLPQYRALKKCIKYDLKKHGSICFKCHVPQLDDVLHPTFTRGSEAACQHPNVMLPLGFHIMCVPEMRQAVLAEHGVKDSSVDSFQTWLSAPSNTHYPTNLCNVLIWFYTSVKQSTKRLST